MEEREREGKLKDGERRNGKWRGKIGRDRKKESIT
jgi:hypothetical protein